MPALPKLRRLDLTGSFGGAEAGFFDWIWQSRLGAGLQELAVSTVPERLQEWLSLMEARGLTRLELALKSIGRVAIAGSGSARLLVFGHPLARPGWNPRLAESFATEVGAVLRDVPPGSVAQVEVHLGRTKLAQKIEQMLRDALAGRGIAKASVVLETGSRRELL
ncbi:MAG TPA: hypothetical protein VGK67_28515 [Myxococcales bacterium]